MRYRLFLWVPQFAYLLFLFLFETSCGQPQVSPRPIADFSYESLANSPGKFKLTNSSENAKRYQWTFGDGQATTDANPTVQYASNGIFTVTLTAKSDATTDVISKSINVIGVPVTGSVMFWTNAQGDSSDVEIFVDQSLQGLINKYQTSGAPTGCGLDGYVTYYNTTGIYSYYAKSKRRTWSGVVEIKKGECVLKLLTR